MSGDGVAVAGDSVVLLQSSAKARTAAIPEHAASVHRAWRWFVAIPHSASSPRLPLDLQTLHLYHTSVLTNCSSAVIRPVFVVPR
jgi:hypothetical protein